MKKIIIPCLIAYALFISINSDCMLTRTAPSARFKTSFVTQRKYHTSYRTHNLLQESLEEEEYYEVEDPTFLEKAQNKQMKEFSKLLNEQITLQKENNQFLRNVLKQNVLLARIAYNDDKDVYRNSETYHDIDKLAKEAWFYNEKE